MRIKMSQQGLSVQAIAGTHVVLLGLNMEKADCNGLMGFAFHRTDPAEQEAYWLEGLKTFKETDPGLPPGAKYSTRRQPIQGFTWSDYSAKPGRKYTYEVLALKGPPHDLQPSSQVSITVQTETPDAKVHDVYFNRGAAASQEYARRFGNEKPNEVGSAAYDWLSRGLYEAMITFIGQANKKKYGLRVCAYEFHYEGVLEALHKSKLAGADVRIIYERRKDKPGKKNDKAVSQEGIKGLCHKRTSNPSGISHNKFIVFLENGNPKAVLTGGTNFSEGGIFGHSNAVHIVEDHNLAKDYLSYWELLDDDPEYDDLKPSVIQASPVPHGNTLKGTSVIFSPRDSLAALKWYAALAAGAKDGLFMTFAFGMHSAFQNVYRTSEAPMRYALLEKATRPMKKGPKRKAEEAKIDQLRAQPENRFAIGAHLNLNMFDRWLAERTSGLNRNVQYVHTKYMLVDPLGPDPIVVAGSANFSEASTTKNDENMLVIRGNKRVAEIYLTEFMRLYNHYAFREWAATKEDDEGLQMKYLRTDDWWEDYFGSTQRSRQREFFG
jgi:phosphatidylserine/phosphatidylglycerophosphate/cardiolipin synthase-like enzyme